MDLAGLILLVLIIWALSSLPKEFGNELRRLVGVLVLIWLVCLVLDYPATMHWTGGFLHALRGAIQQILGAIGIR